MPTRSRTAEHGQAASRPNDRKARRIPPETRAVHNQRGRLTLEGTCSITVRPDFKNRPNGNGSSKHWDSSLSRLDSSDLQEISATTATLVPRAVILPRYTTLEVCDRQM